MLSEIFISDSFAQATQAAPQESSFSSLVPLMLIFAIVYFLMIRPEMKKNKDRQKMINELKKGEKVITNSGILGKVKEIHKNENLIELEISEGVIVQVLKSYVIDVVEEKKDKKDKLSSASKKVAKKSSSSKKAVAKKTADKKSTDKKSDKDSDKSKEKKETPKES